MKNQRISLLAGGVAVLVAVALAVGMSAPQPVYGANKEIVQLQTMVQALQDQMARMQQTFDERMGVMRNLIEQSTDNMNKVTAALDTVQKSIQQQQTEAGGRVEQVSGQIQALHDSVDELKARMARMSKQLDDMQAAQANLPAAGAAQQGMAPGGAAQQPAQPQAPPPDILYNNALRDYTAGKYDLAAQEFNDFLKFYPNTELAGNSQFYLADILYRQGKYEDAINAYNVVLEQYAEGNKAPAAQLKKGYALLELGRRSQGVRELNSLITRYPRSMEAQQARDRLKRLGAQSTQRSSRGE